MGVQLQLGWHYNRSVISQVRKQSFSKPAPGKADHSVASSQAKLVTQNENHMFSVSLGIKGGLWLKTRLKFQVAISWYSIGQI